MCWMQIHVCVVRNFVQRGVRFSCRHTCVDTYASGLEFVLNYSSKLFFHCRDAARTFYIPFKEYSRDTYFSEVAVLSSIWSLYRLLSNSD